MAGEAASGKLGLSRGEESALVTLFVFEILCILLYGAASALGAFGLRRDHRRAARAAKGVYLVAVAAHSAVIGMESVSTEGTLLSGPNIVMLASWVLAVVTAAGLLVTRRGLAFSTVAAPVVALLILVSQWLRILDPAGADNMAFYHWPLLVPHIVLVFVALACFATSAISAALDWYQRRLMAARSAKVLELNTPALDTLALISRLAGLVGLAVLIAAMLIGFTHLVALYAAMAQNRHRGQPGLSGAARGPFPGDDGHLVGVLRPVVPRALGCVGAGPRCPRHRRPCGGGAAHCGVGGVGPWVCSLRA